jgi:uncharacterized membrane protein
VIVTTGGAQTVVDGGRPPRCDDQGNCTCINIAEFGKTGDFGAVQGQDGSTAFQEWLNTKSNAHVDVFATRTTLTPELLANYDVIILQALGEKTSYTQPGDYWTYSAEEVTAVQDWVQNKGGSIVTLTGYFNGNAYEIAPTNQLIAFSGLSYEGIGIIDSPDCPPNPSESAHGQPTCYCWGGSIPISQWNATSPISKNISSVGGFLGRPIKVATGANADIVATFASSGTTYNVAVAVQSGKGRVFAFADEWVTYNSQWDGTNVSQTEQQYNDPYNPCYNQQPQNVFQIPQFWYNTLKWCAPLVDCQLKIDNPQIIIN